MLKFENKQNGRYYYLYVETDIFGDNVLSVIRGGLTHHRRFYRIAIGTISFIEKKIQDITRIRLTRGYTLIN